MRLSSAEGHWQLLEGERVQRRVCAQPEVATVPIHKTRLHVYQRALVVAERDVDLRRRGHLRRPVFVAGCDARRSRREHSFLAVESDERPLSHHKLNFYAVQKISL